MKEVINHEVYGKIEYDESIWTGRKNISINGVVLKKINKTTYEWVNNEETVTVNATGSLIKGLSLQINSDTIEIFPATKWYEYVMAILPFLIVLIWGNVPALCAIIPVVGGAIGGAISGAISILALFLIKKTNNILYKVLIMAVATICAYLICMGIGFIIVGALH